MPGGADSFIKFNVDGLLRGDAKSRSEAYATGIRAGYMTVADVRRLEDLAPLGEELRQPLREVNLAPAALADQKLRADTAASLIAAGFAPDDAAKAAGIEQVIFDRGGYLYHGRVKALADAAREAGLSF